jgi:hypothetical protein
MPSYDETIKEIEPTLLRYGFVRTGPTLRCSRQYESNDVGFRIIVESWFDGRVGYITVGHRRYCNYNSEFIECLAIYKDTICLDVMSSMLSIDEVVDFKGCTIGGIQQGMKSWGTRNRDGYYDRNDYKTRYFC